MIPAFLRRLVGLAPPSLPVWMQVLQDYGYLVHADQHGWYWSCRNGEFSGHYSTEQGAWAAAWAKHEEGSK